MYERKRWTVQVYKGHSFNMVCVSISLSLSFLSLSQSKEITFQLQEDLMKLLNELYTVSGILTRSFFTLSLSSGTQGSL